MVHAGQQGWLIAPTKKMTPMSRPFTMIVRPRVYDADFGWRVWAVDRSGEALPYANPSEWRLFCTLPISKPPPYGPPGHRDEF